MNGQLVRIKYSPCYKVNFQTFYLDVWAGASETHPLWCNGKRHKIAIITQELNL